MTGTNTRTRRSKQRCTIATDQPLDSRLAAVLELKPSSDEVPLEVWCHLVESLRHSITVRRAREGVEVPDPRDLQHATHQAIWSARAALAHLGEGTSERAVRPGGSLSVRTTMRDLTHLIVTGRSTPLDRLRRAVLSHLEALGPAFD